MDKGPTLTWQDKAGASERSSEDKAPSVSVEHGDQGTEAAAAAQVLDVNGGAHQGVQEVGAVTVQHPLQPHQPPHITLIIASSTAFVHHEVILKPTRRPKPTYYAL